MHGKLSRLLGGARSAIGRRLDSELRGFFIQIEGNEACDARSRDVS